MTPGATGPMPGSASSGASSGTGAAGTRVAVRRTGGFAGMTSAGEVDLAADDPRGEELRELIDRIDLAAVPDGVPRPDHFVYDFDLGGRRAVVPEQHLTDDLRRLAELLLENGRSG